ncbi:MAG: UDP-glucose 4-epimerase GalE, partial [Bacteroidetes bacterium]|nr:UDP-glucose 4-epimerase GalE [Bacteroidota bacterium]
EVSGQKLNYQLGDRRPGDVIEVYANNNKARALLGWETKYNLHQMMDTAWRWEQAQKAEAERIQLN